MKPLISLILSSTIVYVLSIHPLVITTHPQSHEGVVIVTSAVTQLGAHETSNSMDFRGQFAFGFVEPIKEITL